MDSHRPVRTWRSCWRRRCFCGLRLPCPDAELAARAGRPIPDGDQYHNGPPSWAYAPTVALMPVNRPLLTRAGLWRARNGQPR